VQLRAVSLVQENHPLVQTPVMSAITSSLLSGCSDKRYIDIGFIRTLAPQRKRAVTTGTRKTYFSP
jgi:hypothetical protein